MTARRIPAAPPAALLTALSVALLAAGCAGTPSPVSRLDSSGLTVVAQSEAVLLTSSVPELTLTAKDFAVIGPVEINRSGALDFYLWLGLGSSVDRKRQGLDPPEAKSLAVLVDGEPMLFPLTDWPIGLDAPPYDAPTPIHSTLAARASLDQIHRIAAADDVEVHLVAQTGRAARYRLWKGRWSAWTTFSAHP